MWDVPFVLALVSRWLHILAAITAVGGTIFARTVVFPTLANMPEGDRNALHAAMRERWSRIVAVAIGFLLVSGLYNFMLTVTEFKVPRWYHPVFGIKFLAAMAIFAIASLLVGKSPAAQAVRRRAKFWLTVNIGLAVLVVCLSGILRTAEKSPKTAPGDESEPAAVSLRKGLCRPARTQLG